MFPQVITNTNTTTFNNGITANIDKEQHISQKKYKTEFLRRNVRYGGLIININFKMSNYNLENTATSLLGKFLAFCLKNNQDFWV